MISISLLIAAASAARDAGTLCAAALFATATITIRLRMVFMPASSDREFFPSTPNPSAWRRLTQTVGCGRPVTCIMRERDSIPAAAVDGRLGGVDRAGD